MAQQAFTMHSEPIDLPSKGWFYPETSPLATGRVDIYYMTAKHEDILTSKNLIAKGVVLDKLMEELIATPGVRLDDLLLCDKDAIMIAARILGYGKEYNVGIRCPSCDTKIESVVDLQEIGEKECPYFDAEHKNRNEFTFELPISKATITYRYLTQADEKTVRAELEGVRKAMKVDVSREVTARLKKIIIAVNGDSDGNNIRQFVDFMPARDAMAFREHIKKTMPGIDVATTLVCSSCQNEGRVEIPIDNNFFWPNSGI
jgi:hypothetical protein